MPNYEFDSLLSYLRAEYGADLRWVANYDSQRYNYKVRHVRKDLEGELKGAQLDHVIHRSLAVYNKRHAEGIYFHLGESDHLTVHYERGTAIHVFLDDHRGVTIMLEPDVSVTLPEFVEDCRERLGAA